jgi:hypothetical protein
MSQLPIDLDAEAIQYEGHWYTREELARRIKQMLDSGDFAVGKPSQALEQLTATLATLRTLAFRLPPEMADQLNQVAARHGRTLGSLIRESISVHLNLRGININEGQAAGGSRPPERLGRKATDPEMPAVPPGMVPSVASPGRHPTPPGGTPVAPQVMAGPGAIRAAQPDRPPPSVVVDKNAIVTEDATPDEIAAAVSLGGPKKKPPPPPADEDTVERGWFGR